MKEAAAAAEHNEKGGRKGGTAILPSAHQMKSRKSIRISPSSYQLGSVQVGFVLPFITAHILTTDIPLER